MKQRFLQEADTEFQEAITYFDTQTKGLGDRFVDEVESALARILEFPESGARVSGNIRKKTVRKFPYSLFYVVGEDELVIVAVAPHRRRPHYWRKRLRKSK